MFTWPPGRAPRRCRVADDQDHVVAVRGVDDDRVGLAVADAADGAGEVDVDLGDVGAATGR